MLLGRRQLFTGAAIAASSAMVPAFAGKLSSSKRSSDMSERLGVEYYTLPGPGWDFKIPVASSLNSFAVKTPHDRIVRFRFVTTDNLDRFLYGYAYGYVGSARADVDASVANAIELLRSNSVDLGWRSTRTYFLGRGSDMESCIDYLPEHHKYGAAYYSLTCNIDETYAPEVAYFQSI